MYDSRATLVTRLTEIRTAIDKVRTAQAYGTSADITIQRANLNTLLEEEKWVLKQIELSDSASQGGPFNRAQFKKVT